MNKLDELSFCSDYLLLDKEFYDFSTPTPLDEPYLIHYNPQTAKLIDFDIEKEEKSRLVAFLNGTFLPLSASTYSMCYAGHQFGNYAPRLGDGRAIHLGAINGWHLQTKGSGETRYSRSSDGRCALPSSIREYLMSEAMYHLGVPSTRALGIIGSKTKLLRNGIERGAIVMRMSQSWIRFGSFEYFFYFKEYEKLEALLNYAIKESYPHLMKEEDRYFKFFEAMLHRTAKLVAQWQGLGFCHGVLNTDNMSIAGVSIDYGPFSMMDDFQFGFVCNSTDKAGRYSYGEQPNVVYWNLTKLSEALSPFIDKKRMEKKLEEYGAFIYFDAYISLMRKKLGLEKKYDEDGTLISDLIEVMHEAYIDHTNFFRTLSYYDGDRMPIFDLAMNPIGFDSWLNAYDVRLEKEETSQKERQEKMLTINPKYILRNYMLDEAITLAKQGDFSRVETLFKIASSPFDEQKEFEDFAKETPEGYKNMILSCSS